MRAAADGRTVVVAGGAGFIGSNFVHLLRRERPGWRIVDVDALTYAGNLANLADLADDRRHRFVRADIADGDALGRALRGADFDAVVNFAAESHVDRSIAGPDAFVRTNVVGTANLLEIVRGRPGTRHVQVSTDEVYGSLGADGRFTEASPLAPSSPYSASKAAADLLVQAWHLTYGLDTVITRSANNYGPFQFPEKLIPLMILNACAGRPLPVYGDGGNLRDWMHVDDHNRGVLAALEHGRSGEAYNFGTGTERRNLDVVRRIAERICGRLDLVRFVDDRPGHDWRYAMDCSKARDELGWRPEVEFEAGLDATIAWYRSHAPWWRDVLSGEYRTRDERWLADRAGREARSPA